MSVASPHVHDTAQETPTTAEELENLIAAAAGAQRAWADTTPADRAKALRSVADVLDAASGELVPIAMRESHLPEARLTGELARTTFQLRLFAEILVEGGFLDARIDHNDPNWGMGPRPDLRRYNVALGPAVVFAASNFPFAFSVAGGDTASALAAGCPVILKAHPGHPELSARTSALVVEGLLAGGAPEGTFSVIYGDENGRAALTDPRVHIGAFTGSIRGGRALFDIANSRDVPIPFYGELGSTNPVFVTAGTWEKSSEEIIDGFVASFTNGAGQFCTKPGLLFVPAGVGAEDALKARFGKEGSPPPAPLLNDRIRSGYTSGLEALVGSSEVTPLVLGDDAFAAIPAPTLLTTTLDGFLANLDTLAAECFGPTALVVTYDDVDRLAEVPPRLQGQLTGTLYAGEDEPIAAELLRLMADRAGRLLWGGWPTGVIVSYAQNHGGPYPATTAPSSTSVGTTAIDRFLRPVAFQNVPQSLLPAPVQESNPWGIPRRVDGKLELA